MRTIISIPEEQIKILSQISKRKKVARAKLIREAVTMYINRINKTEDNFNESFGIWKNRHIDGNVYQQKLRDEW